MTPPQQRTLTNWLLLFALAGLWGTAFLFIKIAVGSIPPLTLAASRILMAAIVLTVAVRLRGLRMPTSGRIWSRYLLLGLIGNALPFALISWGQIRVDSGLTGILMGVIPLFTLALAHFFVPGEQMTPRMVGGFAIGFVGLVVLLGPATLLEVGGESSEFPRQMAILFAAICYAINGILSRRLGTLNALVSSATVMWTASAIALPIALWIDQPWSLAPSLAATTSAIWLGLFATALATIIFFQIVQSAGPTFLSLINYMIPIIALLAGMLFLGEALAGSVLMGLALILAGLAFSQRAPRRR